MGLWFQGTSREERQASQRTVFRALTAFFLASGLLVISNMLYFRNRPFRYHEVNLLFYYPTDSSFPSNSATVVFTIASTVWLYNRRWGWPLIILAIGFGLSRIYCGVHYPGDILAGFVLGGSSAWLLTRYGHRLNTLFDRMINLARHLYLA
jgi:undecaprenyl-diphosphatase